MRCLELLALKEITRTRKIKETQLFCECFVDWYHDFPMSYQERGAWVERLLKSENQSSQLLGAHVVAFVTAPPQSLSGYSGTARRLGQSPPRRLWQDIYDYFARLLEIRFELTQSEDKEIAEITRIEFGEGASQLIGHLPPDQLVTFMERLVEWNFSGKLSSDVRRIRSTIHWLEERYSESSKKPTQEEFRDKWNAILLRLATLRERFDNGNFLLRLKIATGYAFEHEWEAGEGGRVYSYQKRLRALVSEVIHNLNLMTEEAWSVLTDEKSAHAFELIRFLGELDQQKKFLARFEFEVGNRAGNWRFGHYCFGLYRADSAFVENYFDQLCRKLTFQKSYLLKPIEFIGPTLTNRKRLLQFIEDNAITPIEVADVVTGRWLDDLPVAEVVTIMEFIAQDDNWPEWAASVMNLYLHPDKPLPKELIPFGERLLQEIKMTLDNSYKCNHLALGIAKTDLEKSFALLAKHIASLDKTDWREWQGGWNPLQRHGAHEFWDYLRSQDAERAYRCFCTLKNRHVRNEILDYGGQPLLDLENHRAVLLKIANENEEDAERIAASISIKQPGFFPFAFDLLSGRPIDGKVASYLSSTIVERFGFGYESDKLQIALNDVESELKKTDVPNHGHAWLERLKQKIQEAIKASPWDRGENEYLGWS